MNAEISTQLTEQANAMNECVAAGMRAQAAIHAINLKGLRTAYDRALADPETKIPTFLHAMLEQVLRG